MWSRGHFPVAGGASAAQRIRQRQRPKSPSNWHVFLSLPHRFLWCGRRLQQSLQGHLRPRDHLPEEEGGEAAAAAAEATQGSAVRAQRAGQEGEGRPGVPQLPVLGTYVSRPRKAQQTSLVPCLPAAACKKEMGHHCPLTLGGSGVHTSSLDSGLLGLSPQLDGARAPEHSVAEQRLFCWRSEQLSG